MAINLETITNIPGTYFCKPAAPSELERTLFDHGITLPSSHFGLLSEANGLSVFNGYYRLFGVGCETCTDLIRWNNHEAWKFAWDRDVSRFLSFGESGFGDQFAYDRESKDSRIYMLDAFRMEPEVIADTFDSFFRSEIIANVRKPSDNILLQVSKSIGPLRWSDHVTYIPSLLLDDNEDPNRVQKIDARTSMIINGDVWSQCSKANWSGQVISFEEYLDSKGRGRLKLNWKPD